MFIGLPPCFLYVVLATYVISGCHAASNHSSTESNTTNPSSGRMTTYSTKQSTLSGVTPTYTTTVSGNSYQKPNSSSTAFTSSGKITTSSTKQSKLSGVTSTYTTTVSRNSYQEQNFSSTAFTSSGKITTSSTKQSKLSRVTPTYTTTVSYQEEIFSSTAFTATASLALGNETSETAIYSTTYSAATTNPTKEVTSIADTVIANVSTTQLSHEKTSSPNNADFVGSSTRMPTTYSTPTTQSTSSEEISSTYKINVSTTDSHGKTHSSSIAPTSSASTRETYSTTQTTLMSINTTVTSPTKVSSITEMPKSPACPESIAKSATFPTEYKAILIVCLVVVLILVVGCIIERKRCCNVENSKETRRSGDDIEVIPLTMECTTGTTATNPMYSFGDCIDQKEAPETSTVDQEPGSKSDTKQADGTHVIEIELHPQSQNQKNTDDHATSSDAVDNIAQPSTSKAEDGRGDSDKDSGKDGGESDTGKPEIASKSKCAPKEADDKQVEPSTKPAKDELGPQSQGDTPDSKSDGVQDGRESGTSKPEVASNSKCAPKEADVKQVEPSTKTAKDELGPQSQGDTPDNKSDGVQDVVQRSSLSAEVAEAVMKGVDNKNGKDGGEEVSGKPEADAKSECEPAHKSDVEQVNNSTQDVSEHGQQPQLREINLGDITIKEMKLF